MGGWVVLADRGPVAVRSGGATAADPRRLVGACLQRHQQFGSGGRRTARHGRAVDVVRRA
eukprot:3842246-Rhodomonas_salina.1